eukprot:266008_1
MIKILSEKQNKMKFVSGFNTRINARYQQLSSQLNEQTDEKMIDQKKYNFGTSFEYGYNGEICGHISVSPKYSSLKEELTNNHIVRLNIVQFNMQYAKAQIVFNSYYRKRLYFKMCIENIVSLMFYCNYDQLQFQFSRTYYVSE